MPCGVDFTTYSRGVNVTRNLTSLLKVVAALLLLGGPSVAEGQEVVPGDGGVGPNGLLPLESCPDLASVVREDRRAWQQRQRSGSPRPDTSPAMVAASACYKRNAEIERQNHERTVLAQVAAHKEAERAAADRREAERVRARQAEAEAQERATETEQAELAKLEAEVEAARREPKLLRAALSAQWCIEQPNLKEWTEREALARSSIAQEQVDARMARVVNLTLLQALKEEVQSARAEKAASSGRLRRYEQELSRSRLTRMGCTEKAVATLRACAGPSYEECKSSEDVGGRSTRILAELMRALHVE